MTIVISDQMLKIQNEIEFFMVLGLLSTLKDRKEYSHNILAIASKNQRQFYRSKMKDRLLLEGVLEKRGQMFKFNRFLLRDIVVKTKYFLKWKANIRKLDDDYNWMPLVPWKDNIEVDFDG